MKRSSQTDTSPQDDTFGWAIPVMRAGYLGRALVYTVVAGVSLWAIWQGGQATGTSEALARLEGSWGGSAVLVLILVGMICYAVWRLLDSVFDLEDYGTEAKGIVARSGMIVTGLAHLAIAGIVAKLLFDVNAASGGSGSDGSAISGLVAQAMSLPGGRWIVGCVGLATFGAGIYYIDKGWNHRYRKHLRANDWTFRMSKVLLAGVVAQGVIVGAIGALFVLAALRANPGEAGGVNKVFAWAYSTPAGWILVAAICLGLLGFAIFCLVNAIWRIVPKADGPDIKTLGEGMAAKARRSVN